MLEILQMILFVGSVLAVALFTAWALRLSSRPATLLSIYLLCWANIVAVSELTATFGLLNYQAFLLCQMTLVFLVGLVGRRGSSGGGIEGHLPIHRGDARLMQELGVPPDFDYMAQSAERNLRYIHKRIGKTDLYFVAIEKPRVETAICSFRVQGKRPELWWPDSGRMERPGVYEQAGDCVRIPIRFDPSGSVFVMFRPGEAIEGDRITCVKRDGELVVDLRKKELAAVAVGGAGIELVRAKGKAVEVHLSQPGTYTLTSADGTPGSSRGFICRKV